MDRWKICTFMVFLATIGFGHCLQCYVCMSKEDHHCISSDPKILEKFKMDCSVAADADFARGKVLNRCSKSVNKGEYARGCYWADPKVADNTCRSADDVTACLCTGEFCNAAESGRFTMGQTTKMLLAVSVVAVWRGIC